MKLYLEKSRCKIHDSLNGFFLEVETDGPIDFTGGDGHDYLLYDEDEEGIGPAPNRPFVIENGNYLEEKIKKATESWKGVDVDKFMDQIRGRDE